MPLHLILYSKIFKDYIMKRIIMFKGGVETLEFFSVEIAEYLESKGYEIFWYNLLLSKNSFNELMHYYNNQCNEQLYAITFNFEGLEGEEGLYNNDGWNFWDYSGVTVINIVVDHPLYYNQFLKALPEHYRQVNIDHMHIDYMKRFFPDVDVYFIPSAGTELNKHRKLIKDYDYLPMCQRPIDVIFTGNYTPKHILRKQLNNMEQDYIDFYESALERLIMSPDLTIDELSEMCLKEEFPEITDEQLANCMPPMMYVDLSVRFHYRQLVIRMLADSGIKLNTYGSGYNYIECNHPENIIMHGGVNSQKCLDMISQSKISLNVMPWFKNGIHDRIFNSCLNGAVSLSDSSIYIDELFTDRQNIILYDLNMLRDYELSVYDLNITKPLTDYIKELLADDNKLQAIADNAYSLCHNRHDWKNRASIIEALLR